MSEPKKAQDADRAEVLIEPHEDALLGQGESIKLVRGDVESFKVAAPMVNQMPKKYGEQYDLFDGLPTSWKKQVQRQDDTQILTISNNCTASELLLLPVLGKLLYDQTERAAFSGDHLIGSEDPNLLKGATRIQHVYHDEKGAKVVPNGGYVAITPSAMFREYKGKPKDYKPSGSERRRIKNLLIGLSKKTVYMESVATGTENGKPFEYRSKMYEPLITFREYAKAPILDGIDGKTKGEPQIIYQIKLNRLYVADALRNGVTFPANFPAMMCEALENKNPSAGPIKLIYKLIHQAKHSKTFKKKECDILKEMNPRVLAQGRIGRVQKELDQALKAAKSLGVMKSYKKKKSTDGSEVIFHFDLNPEWATPMVVAIDSSE